MVSAPPAKPKPQRVADPRLRRVLKDDAHKLTAVGGLAALSLDALSSVAYGPEAIVLALIAGGVGAIAFTLPVAIAITVLLIVLVFSYRQVIAVHPEGGGSYAVAKKDLGRGASLVAAASLVVDYVLTVAVSLAAGAASLASAFPVLAPHLLSITLIGLAILTVINLIGISESAKVLMLPTLLFIACILAVIVFGLTHSTPVAVIGKELGPVEPVSALGIVLVLKAFAAGCSSLTGVEAIANGVPAFKNPAITRAQNTEVALGILLGVMLIGLSVLIKAHHVVPRGDVTILAQLSAAAFGTGLPFYVTNVTVALILGFAANTSFGGLPVLMSLLAKDDRMPHLFGLRAEKPVYRYGVVALSLFSAIILIAAMPTPIGCCRSSRSVCSSDSRSAKPGWSSTGSAHAPPAGTGRPRSTGSARHCRRSRWWCSLSVSSRRAPGSFSPSSHCWCCCSDVPRTTTGVSDANWPLMNYLRSPPTLPTRRRW